MQRLALLTLILAVGVTLLGYCLTSVDLLKGNSSEVVISDWQLQISLLGFCISPLVGKISNTVETSSYQSEYTFAEHGGINEDEYDKGSVYSVLYSLYANVGNTLKFKNNDTYEFTFNTWGISPSDFGEEDPQRHGKTSYSYFSKSPEVQEHLQTMNGLVQIVEIGCGTGAGASHLSSVVFPKSQYMAIDMQKAAIETCKRLHASDRLECVHIPSGVGNANGIVPLADGSVDFVIIVETHIAEDNIGLEEKAVFAEISRILKPGGYLLWGNAVPTYVWYQAEEYLQMVGYRMVARWNNTKNAVLARDEDAERVNAVMTGIYEHHFAFKMPYFGKPCWEVINLLIRNFYRDPTTALYDKMVKGYHSYMHYVFQVDK